MFTPESYGVERQSCDPSAPLFLLLLLSWVIVLRCCSAGTRWSTAVVKLTLGVPYISPSVRTAALCLLLVRWQEVAVGGWYLPQCDMLTKRRVTSTFRRRKRKNRFYTGRWRLLSAALCCHRFLLFLSDGQMDEPAVAFIGSWTNHKAQVEAFQATSVVTRRESWWPHNHWVPKYYVLANSTDNDWL